MADYRPPIRDIRFTLDHVVDLAGVCDMPHFEHVDVATVHGVIEESGRFFADVVAPLYRVGDEHGSRLVSEGVVETPPGYREAYRAYVEAGWGAVPFPADYGGGGFPWTSALAMQEMLTSADMSFSMCPLLTQGSIDMLLAHGSEEQRERYLRKMVSGEWTGTMNLTEPQAGSDVGALRTRAEPAGDGTYRITGTKIFITFGEHDLSDQIIHLVLARTPDSPPGTKGISCFIVPKFLVNDDGSLGERDDVTCQSLEHKLGIKASPTCALSYGDRGGAVGYLIGEEHQGMRYMFTMMNNARLSVGVEGVSLGERAYQQALAYAVERRQGRAPGAPAGEQSPIIDHPDIRRTLLLMRSHIDAMRALVFETAVALDRASHHPDEGERDAAQEVADLLTPMAKAWCTDLGVELTSHNIQVHGGMGYIEETGAAQLYRDSRIPPIYEGTNGIQAMDLVGRKLPLRGGAVIEEHLARIGETASGLGNGLGDIGKSLDAAVGALSDATAWIFEHGAADPADALAAATPYLRMASTVTGGWLMARQAAAASRLAKEAGSADERAYYQGKLHSARFFCTQVLPQAAGLLAAATSSSGQLLEPTVDQLASS